MTFGTVCSFKLQRRPAAGVHWQEVDRPAIPGEQPGEGRVDDAALRRAGGGGRCSRAVAQRVGAAQAPPARCPVPQAARRFPRWWACCALGHEKTHVCRGLDAAEHCAKHSPRLCRDRRGGARMGCVCVCVCADERGMADCV